jgi:hypothetical protein
MANLFWLSAAQVYKELGPGPHSAATLLSRYGWTFTRADGSTCATWLNNERVGSTAAAGFLRMQYDATLNEWGFLLEGSRTNAWTKSEELDDGVWGKDAASVSANVGNGMDGTQHGDKIVEDGTNALHGFNRATPTLTNNTKSTVSVYSCYFGSRTWFRIRTTDKAGTLRSTFFNIAAGTIGTTDAGHTGVSIEGPLGPIGSQGYRCSVTFDSASGGTAPLVQFFMATADNSGAYAGDGTSGMIFTDVMFETDQPFRSSYIKTTTAAVTRAADSLTLSIPDGPRDVTVLSRTNRMAHADASGDIGIEPATFKMGTTGKHIRGNFQQASRLMRAFIGTNGGTDTQQTTTFPAGAVISTANQFRNLTTAGLCKLDTGSGYTADSSAATAVTAFGNQTLEVGSNSATHSLYGLLFDLKGRGGLQTLASMLTEPGFAPDNPFEVTDFDLPGPLISKAQSGRVNLRSTQQIGRTWTERYLLNVQAVADKEFLARMATYWRNGTIFAKGHIDYATMKGIGGGTPRVKGASQTGSTLIVDGCPLNTSGWLLAGDIFRVQGLAQVLQVSADVNTEGDGRALLPLVTPLFTGGSPSDNAGLTITGVTLDVVLLEPPSFPTTSGTGANYGELVLKFSEAL